MSKKMTRNIILGILATVLIGLALIYTSPNNFRPVEEKSFSSSSWKKGDARIRASMANDLMRSDTLLNLTKKETLELLGDPDMNFVKGYFYKLNFGHNWWPDDDWTYRFEVHFDSTMTVTHAGYSD